MKTGVPSSIERPSVKQKRDRKKRKTQAKQAKKAIGNVLGNLTYHCSNANCNNRVRMKEDLGERKVLCTKCNAGIFKRRKSNIGCRPDDDQGDHAPQNDIKQTGCTNSLDGDGKSSHPLRSVPTGDEVNPQEYNVR